MTAAAQIQPSAPSEWNALARIMTASASGALLSGLLSAAAAKTVALLAGPAAIGLLATLQQIRETALTAATANGQTALVQGLARGSPKTPAARAGYFRAVSIVFSFATAATACFLWLAPARVARWAGLAVSNAPLVRWIAAAVVLSSLYVFLSGLLKALGAARSLAWLQLAGPAGMALLAFAAARSRWPMAFGALLAASAAVTALSAAAALFPYRARLKGWICGQGRAGFFRPARHFFSISAVMFATSLAASAALVAVRARIIRVQGLAEAGQFDAAWTISMNQVSLVLASLETHYLPSLAKLERARDRGAEIGRVLALAAPAAAVVIAILAAAKPLWLGALYSRQFAAAARFLRWTLLGDYLKVSSWILSTPMLASADMRVFLAADLAATAAFLGSAIALARFWTPAEAAAIAFVLMHAVHLAISWAYARLRHAFRLAGLAACSWIGGLALAVGVSLWSWNV